MSCREGPKRKSGNECEYGHDRSELDGGEEVASELIVAGGNAPEVFQSAEAALDDIAPLCMRAC